MAFVESFGEGPVVKPPSGALDSDKGKVIQEIARTQLRSPWVTVYRVTGKVQKDFGIVANCILDPNDVCILL